MPSRVIQVSTPARLRTHPAQCRPTTHSLCCSQSHPRTPSPRIWLSAYLKSVWNPPITQRIVGASWRGSAGTMSPRPTTAFPSPTATATTSSPGRCSTRMRSVCSAVVQSCRAPAGSPAYRAHVRHTSHAGLTAAAYGSVSPSSTEDVRAMTTTLNPKKPVKRCAPTPKTTTARPASPEARWWRASAGATSSSWVAWRSWRRRRTQAMPL